MFKYILKRIGYMLVTLFIIATATFFMMHSIPGDPLGAMANKLPEQAKANYYAKYGLDKPKTEQYAIFMKNLITNGDLGESLKYPGKSITDTLLTNSKVSGAIGGLALAVGLAIGVTLGIVAALNKNKWPDYLVMFIAILGITIPVFVLAALLQYVFTDHRLGQTEELCSAGCCNVLWHHRDLCPLPQGQYAGCYGTGLYPDCGGKGRQPLPHHQGPCPEKCFSALHHHPGRTDFRYLHRLLCH